MGRSIRRFGGGLGGLLVAFVNKDFIFNEPRRRKGCEGKKEGKEEE